ncbi:MAG: uracil-DNA glycosylase [bacterium]
MNKKSDIKKFVELLAQEKFNKENRIFNMYAGEKGINQRENLINYLEEMYDINPKILWMGEAAGPHGALHTGIPFTDELILSKRPIIINQKKLFEKKYFYSEKVHNENSAKNIWSIIREANQIPLLWNGVPFYPFEKDNYTQLRSPSSKEIKKFSKFIEHLLEIFKSIEYFAGIGRKGQKAIVEAIKIAFYIRHPSNGGDKKFKRQAKEYLESEYKDSLWRLHRVRKTHNK